MVVSEKMKSNLIIFDTYQTSDVCISYDSEGVENEPIDIQTGHGRQVPANADTPPCIETSRVLEPTFFRSNEWHMSFKFMVL